MLPNVLICMFFVITLFGFLTTLSVLMIVIGSEMQWSHKLRIQIYKLGEIEEEINSLVLKEN